MKKIFLVWDCRTWQEAFEKIYISKGQGMHFQLANALQLVNTHRKGRSGAYSRKKNLSFISECFILFDAIINRIVYFILSEVEGSSVSSRRKGIISSFRNEVTKTHCAPWREQPGFPRFLPSPPSVHVAAGGSGLLAGRQDSTWYSSVDASL